MTSMDGPPPTGGTVLPAGPAPRGDLGGGHPQGRGSGALLWLLGAVVVLTAVVGAALVGGWLPQGDQASAPAPVAPTGPPPPRQPTVDPVAEREAALVALLERRSAALLARDAAAWSADVDAASVDFAARQAAVLANLGAVPVASWTYEYAGAGMPPPAERRVVLGPESWVARVVLVYRLAEADSADVRREQHLTVVRRDGRWLLADDTDGPTATDVWDLGPVTVERGARSLVLGTAAPEDLAQYAGQVDAAAARVDAVWGSGWPRVVVVVVPRDQAEMARLLQRADEAGLEQIAAVTTGEVGLGVGESADRVIINPAGFGLLDDVGREVVLTHEITHVATRATGTRDVPIWLSEGFADYVAYLGTDLPRESVAADVLDRVSAGAGPTALPDVAAFDPVNGDIAPAYSGSWLAVDLIARTYGQPAVLAFYAAVARGAGTPDPAGEARTPVERAFADVLGTDQATFEQEWQGYLAELAR